MDLEEKRKKEKRNNEIKKERYKRAVTLFKHDEFAYLELSVKQSGMTVGAYVRQAVFEKIARDKLNSD